MANIVIVGSGVVGSATGKGLAEKGHRVVFHDIDGRVLERLGREGYATVPSLGLVKDADFVFLTVPTPTVGGRVDLGPLRAAARETGGLLWRVMEKEKADKAYPVVVVKSTVPPGTTEHLALPLLERYSRKKTGRDFGLVMNPEYLRERHALEDMMHPKLILIGAADDRSAGLMEELYASFEAPVVRVRPQEAELQKYVHNLFNATKISFFNEMRDVGERLGCDTDKIFRLAVQSAEASWNPSYGTEEKGPFEGACLPKDTAAFLTWSKDELGIFLRLLDSTIRVNDGLAARRQDARSQEDAEREGILPAFSPAAVRRMFYSSPRKKPKPSRYV
jgi:UDPglucose 6-dehydrogenase